MYIDDPASGVLSHGSDISCGFVPYSLTYDGAYDVFYATSVDDRNVVWEVERGGRQRILFGADSEAARLLGDKQISSIHYAGNTGTLFILCSSCGLVYEVWRIGTSAAVKIL